MGKATHNDTDNWRISKLSALYGIAVKVCELRFTLGLLDCTLFYHTIILVRICAHGFGWNIYLQAIELYAKARSQILRLLLISALPAHR